MAIRGIPSSWSSNSGSGPLGRNRLLHALFRRECILHTPLIAGFRSKLWAAATASGVYRGLYEWDGAEQATDYANHLVRLLNPFSIQGSVRYHVIPGCRREDFLHDPELVAAGRGQRVHDWWRLTEPLDAVPARLG